MSKQSKGGKATAIKLRNEALKNYYENPNYCANCNNIIEIPDDKKVSEIRKKKFCTKSCAASYNNKRFIKRKKQVKQKADKIDFYKDLTKEDLFKSRKNWQSARSAIQKHARRTYNNSDQPKKCKVCGYDKHYEICHIKPVSDFPDIALITEINDISNLVALCPTHHWEFDNLGLDLDAEPGTAPGQFRI